MTLELLIGSLMVISTMVGGFAAIDYFLSGLIRNISKKKKDETKDETIENRIDTLINSITKSASIINEIEQEINERSKLVEKLKIDASYYKELVEIDKPKIEAITQVLRSEIHIAEKKSRWKNRIENFIFFLMGAFVSYLLSSFSPFIL